MTETTQTPPGAPPGDSVTARFLSAGGYIKHSISQILDVIISTALAIPIEDAARARLTRLVTSGFYGTYGREMAALTEEVDQVSQQFTRVQDELTAVREEIADTPETVPGSRANRGKDAADHVESSFADWQLRHQVGAVVLLLLLAGALLASLVTAHANIIGTELPVFLENPILPWSMAALAPMSALAVKTMISHIQGDGPRKVLTYALIVAAAGSIVAWLMLFAINYHGLSAGFSAGGLFDEPSWWDEVKETAFVAAALTTEILVGALLALKLSKIAAIYAPEYEIDNPGFNRLTDRLKALKDEETVLGARLVTLKGALAEYEHSLATQIELALLAHDGRRGRTEPPTL